MALTKLLLVACLAVCVLSQDPYERAKALLAKMTLQEKIHMVTGVDFGKPYQGNVRALPHLNIPALTLEDGPQGVADGIKDVTCFPSVLTTTATWSGSLMNQYAQAVAKEQRLKGTNIHLGPMVNIARVPQGGRNFESMGEDPVLTSHMAVEYIKGVQSQGVIATIKHWVCNTQEIERNQVSANVDERTLQEIYYPAFKAGVDAGVGSVMCSYNKINNTWACENEETLTNVLKKQMGFKGFVMSDWWATHTTAKAANAGLDQEMPDPKFFGPELEKAVQDGSVPQSQVDDMALRILYSLYAGGIMDTPQTGDLNVDARSSTRAALSRVVAEQGTVLLKNDGLLPLPTGVKKIAVIGSDGHDAPIFHGDGSGGVWSEYVVTPLQGIRNRVRGAAVSYANSNDTDLAISFAKSAEVAIVFLGKKSGEGDDYKLPFEQKEDDLVRAIAKVQKNIIVVAHVPAAVLMPWANDVRSIVCAFYPGQEMGNAVASILFGDVNPSGKLPVTFPTSEKAIPVNTPIQYPGINLQTNYTEKLQVGYRWYDANNVAPQFPFGHGLSYTRFNYTSVRMIGRLVRAGIQNIGQREGAEVVQMYIAFPKEADEPPQLLKNFMKITLKPGEAQNFAFDITDRDISIYDVASKSWKVVPGTYQVRIGSSSRDIRLTTTFTV